MKKAELFTDGVGHCCLALGQLSHPLSRDDKTNAAVFIATPSYYIQANVWSTLPLGSGQHSLSTLPIDAPVSVAVSSEAKVFRFFFHVSALAKIEILDGSLCS